MKWLCFCRGRHSSESGNVTVVVAAVLLCVGLVFLSMFRIARVAIEASSAQAGADAVALSAAVGGIDAAQRVAALNGVHIERIVEDAPNVTVTVSLIGSDQLAVARAQSDSDERRAVQIPYWVRGP